MILHREVIRYDKSEENEKKAKAQAKVLEYNKELVDFIETDKKYIIHREWVEE